MILKSPCMSRPIDETILDNKILVVSTSSGENGISAAGYTITLRKVKEYVESIRDTVPETIAGLIHAYGADERLLSDVDEVEVFADQRTAYNRSEELADWDDFYRNATESTDLIEALQSRIFNEFVLFYFKELPEEVDYLD